LKKTINIKLIREIYEENKSDFNVNDEYFFKNCYSKSIEKYIERLKQIDFSERGTVLDFGCGYGQWAFALSQLNLKVIAYDYDQKRIKICNKIKQNKCL
jgi:2-polyprenyl-3-methyl-5-hydroxy-6-metoxy-1,4-benzoquinol methylase